MIKNYNEFIRTAQTCEDFYIKKFLDFDKNKDKIYDNIFLDDSKIVVKVPISLSLISEDKIKVKEFNLSNTTFLTSY